jgi:hypothetical protein
MLHEPEHINLKIFACEPAPRDLAGAILVFHRWIQESALDELLIDVADYRHLPAGPGVILVGFEANYSLDLAENRLGLLYNRKKPVPGPLAGKLRQAYEAAWSACRRLEAEPEFRGELRFHPHACEVIFNDRLLAPNTPETFEALRAELEAFFAGLLGSTDFKLERVGEPRERLRVRVAPQASALAPQPA